MADGFLTVTVRDSDTQTRLQGKLKQLVNDEETKYGINKILVEMINEYVPEDTGELRQSVDVTPDTVSWRTPYAHYQYIGTVYGPNYPIKDADGWVIGWRSRRGFKKHPTNRSLGWYYGYTTPGTGPDWVNEMWQNERRVANLRITNYMKRRVKELDL